MRIEKADDPGFAMCSGQENNLWLWIFENCQLLVSISGNCPTLVVYSFPVQLLTCV
jgi:hypothetical protein